MTFNLPGTLGANAPSFKGLRLSKKNIEALEAMAYEGLSPHIAADRFGIRKDNLQRAFDTPKVRSVFRRLVDHIRSNAGQQAYMRIVELSQTASSERVRADCNKWLAGIDGISPVQKVQGQHSHRHSFGGFVVDNSDPDADLVTVDKPA